ncbi:S-DNA-T family DNA segregation ATPase FtsK/SpoIIIE [Streptomyces sp. BK022]|uniref:ATP-binding protein n=1 Tax=Streptomyces sp. BK022 TaxID=2512123 RepID=UPI00102A0E1E|nr:ATP-binding protein [Streptomyces sp. BK022]RZU29474.1 S-DNA-T family DNA segregation ATPase FtsK/SpoIIIE [Streptomyces sp. BK022]
MDWKQAWSTTANTTNSALDALAPVCVPFAVRWDLEADRRDKLRTPEHLKALMAAQKEHNAARSTHATAKSQQLTARAASNNPFAAGRRAARVASKAASRHERDTRAKLKAARVNYPSTLKARAIQAHSLHAVPTVITSVVMSASHLTLWPAATSAVLIGANVAGLALGRRKLRVPVDESVTVEERQLMERLDPSYWVEHAPDRGLSGTVTTPPAMEPGGIRCEIRLDGTWTVKTLADKADSIRALLGARTALRIRITSASRGGWAALTLATRSAAAGVSSLWTPDRIPADPLAMSLGLDTETGDEVLIPFDERLLVSGASGTGKSWSFRPLMATAHLRGDLLLIDGKGEEATVWEHACRVAVESDEITAGVDDAHAEMTRRKADMKQRGISVWDGRQLTVVVDEGQVILALISKDKERLQRLIELSSLGRSRGVVLWWATQYPLTDGGAPGVHKLIAPNLLTRFSLRVAGTTQAQVALDDCAHYAPHQIPEGREYRGHGYLKGYGPRMLRTWTLDDAGVRKLPKSIWTPEQSGQGPAAPLHLVKEPAASSGALSNRDKVLAAVQAGARTAKDVADATGLNKGTVSREIKSLVASGALVRSADGRLLPGQQAA